MRTRCARPNTRPGGLGAPRSGRGGLGRTRRRVYGTDPATLAQMARRRHATLASVEGAATGVGGFVTLVPDLVGLAWIQSRLVFFVAAAYGYDPLDPMRPAELLVINGLYKTPRTRARRWTGWARPSPRPTSAGKLARDEALADKLLKMVGKSSGKKLAGA